MLELHNITKSYPTMNGRHYVFKDLSFKFPDDANIGLIGPNGAGKSTLMRMLGGVDAPDSGRIVTDRKISWPVGLAKGMQKNLTGRDNVKFVCRLYGATGDAMRDKVRFVEQFATLGNYFDAVVGDYSSGMRSRLAFGTSMAFDFDYYLIDEVTAVGDASFRRKCAQVFRVRLKKSNLIIVSHDMDDIREWCDVVVLIDKGGIQLFEDVEAGIAAYLGPGMDVDRELRLAARARRRAHLAFVAAKRRAMQANDSGKPPADGSTPAP